MSLDHSRTMRETKKGSDMKLDAKKHLANLRENTRKLPNYLFANAKHVSHRQIIHFCSWVVIVRCILTELWSLLVSMEFYRLPRLSKSRLNGFFHIMQWPWAPPKLNIILLSRKEVKSFQKQTCAALYLGCSPKEDTQNTKMVDKPF